MSHYTCGHADAAAGPLAQLPIQHADSRIPVSLPVFICRRCVLSLTGYPEELTRTLDAVITGKKFGRLEMTVQNGVPGVVRFDDTLKVESWQTWPRKNWLTETKEGL